jgi:pSer/pThr/pTyr-binding forkhead associated (FHA) protein
MAILFEVIEGPDLGKKFRVALGMRLGRGNCDITLSDKKVSGVHAIIEKDQQNHLVLVDQDSSNGIKLAGRSVKRVMLLPGVEFRLGQTLIKVKAIEENVRVEEPQMEAPAGPVCPKDWRKALNFWVSQVPLQDIPSPTKSVLSFEPAIKLIFIEGVQSDEEIFIGFGPRKAGSDILDIDIHESSAPAIAFELEPINGSAIFKTSHPKIVLVNEEEVSLKTLRDGDLIRIGKTLIRVNFVSSEEVK